MPAWIDEFKIIRDRAIWTAPFIPPPDPYTVGDQAAIVGSVAWVVGTLAAVEQADAAAIVGGAVGVTGTLAAMERVDRAVFVYSTWNYLAALEMGDTARFTAGHIRSKKIVGQRQVASITGHVRLPQIAARTAPAPQVEARQHGHKRVQERRVGP